LTTTAAPSSADALAMEAPIPWMRRSRSPLVLELAHVLVPHVRLRPPVRSDRGERLRDPAMEAAPCCLTFGMRVTLSPLPGRSKRPGGMNPSRAIVRPKRVGGGSIASDQEEGMSPADSLQILEQYAVVILPLLVVAEQIGVPSPRPGSPGRGALAAHGRVSIRWCSARSPSWP